MPTNSELLKQWMENPPMGDPVWHRNQMRLTRARYAAIIAGSNPTTEEQRAIEVHTSRAGLQRPILASDWLWVPTEVAEADRIFWVEPQTIEGTTVLTSWPSVWDAGGDALSPAGNPAPAIVDPDANFGRSVFLEETASNNLTGPGVAFDYRAFSDGTGGTFGLRALSNDALDTTQMAFSTFNTVTGQTGIYVRINLPAGRVQLVVSNGAGGTAMFSTQVNNVIPTNQPFSLAISWADNTPGVGGTGTYDYSIVVDGVLVERGELDSTVVPDTGDPQSVMRVGARSTLSEEFTGNIAAAAAFRGQFAQELGTYLHSLEAV